MLHIVTVHWQDDRWVDIQLKYLNRNINTRFKVYAFLNSIPGHHRAKFFYSSTEEIPSHAVKLNLLADMAAFDSAGPDDWLMFIDGDAFPIGDICAFGAEKLAEYPLLAIQRKENRGDIQPHPSFCLTTIGFWREIQGDWKSGRGWRDIRGNLVSDVGGSLLDNLRDRGVRWFPMRRSNKRNLHPLWFGIYEDLVYHHGSGFRGPISRLDCGGSAVLPLLCRLHGMMARILPRRASDLLNPLGKIIRRNSIMSTEVYRAILADDGFYRYFQGLESGSTSFGWSKFGRKA